MNRESTQIKIITAMTGIVSQFIVGLLFIAGGGIIAWRALEAEDHTIVYVGIGVAVFGAMMLPSIFPIAKNIYITVFPNGLPILGGRRVGDPPAPPQEPPV